jgi:hypothetical protein
MHRIPEGLTHPERPAIMAHLFMGEAMLFESGSFDRTLRRGIHLGKWVLTCALAALGCKDEPPPEVDAGLVVARPQAEEPVQPPAEDAGLDASLTQDVTSGEDAGDGAEGPDDEGRLSAEGRARKGMDIGLSRDHAAAMARRNLLKKLKDRGILPPETKELQGAAIDRYWMRGKYVYAEASISLGEEPDDVNVPAEGTSKPANQGQPPGAATPEGGPRP